MSQAPGPVMLDLEGTKLRREERDLLRRPEVGGVILFSRNIEHATQVRELCDAVRRIRPELLLAIDQEGGRVQRLTEGVTRLPAMGRIGQEYAESPQVAQRLSLVAGWLLGLGLAACGWDLGFAPVFVVVGGFSGVIGVGGFSAVPG